MPTVWSVDFLHTQTHASPPGSALIILNQPFSPGLLRRVWDSCEWRCCADGGANRLYDLFNEPELSNRKVSRTLYLPHLIKGDLDSIRDDVRAYYASHGVPIIQDDDQDTTDLMKCISAAQERECIQQSQQYDIILLGGLSGRLDQTIHTLSYLHKLHKTRPHVFAVTDDNVAWVLGAGEHIIQIDHNLLGKTCGLLPVGVESTVLTTSGLRWNLADTPSSFDGMISTSNHLVPEHKEVRVQTSRPIWWTAELKSMSWE